MLTLVGLGLFDEKDVTLRGLEEARNADKVYIELYTGIWHGSLEKLKELVDKDIIELHRKDLEDNSKEIVEQAKSQRIVIFVQGDPMVATTHSSLILDAKKQDIETKVIHNASIVSAITETGLHIYKFGQTVTIPFPEKTKGKLPESVYETIRRNKNLGLHTLCLLDIGEGKQLSVNEGLEILLKLEEKGKGKIITDDNEIVVFTVGENSKITYSKIKQIINNKFELPAIIIILGKLHFTEREYLQFKLN